MIVQYSKLWCNSALVQCFSHCHVAHMASDHCHELHKLIAREMYVYVHHSVDMQWIIYCDHICQQCDDT